MMFAAPADRVVGRHGEHLGRHDVGHGVAHHLPEALLELLLPAEVDEVAEQPEVMGQAHVGVFDHEVALGDDADEAAVAVDHRHAAQILLLQQQHEVVNGGLGRDRHDVALHDVGHARVARAAGAAFVFVLVHLVTVRSRRGCLVMFGGRLV